MIEIIVAVILLCLLIPALVAGHSLAPWAPSRHDDIEGALDLAKAKAGETFYDLGCGEGRALFIAAGRGLHAVGIELAPLLFLATKLRTMFGANAGKDVEVRFGNVFRSDLSGADIIYIYGLPHALGGPLAEKLKKEAKPGARLVSCRFRMREWKEDATARSAEHNTPIYLYELDRFRA